MGKTDRIVRVVIAVVIAGLYYGGYISGTLGLVLLILAAVFVITSFMGYCPLYAPLGLNTCANKEKK